MGVHITPGVRVDQREEGTWYFTGIWQSSRWDRLYFKLFRSLKTERWKSDEHIRVVPNSQCLLWLE